MGIYIKINVKAVNFLAPIHLSKIFFKLFKNQKSGHIVNIASVAGYLPGI
jgi:short-subunit dehydrogenase